MAIRRTSFSPWNRPIAVSKEAETLRRQREVWAKMREVLWVLQWCAVATEARRDV